MNHIQKYIFIKEKYQIIISPKEKTVTTLNAIVNCIYGSAINLSSSEFQMFNDFIIQDNYSFLTSTINIEKNCKAASSIPNSIRGGQIYIS